MMKIVDLSHLIYAEMPVFPGTEQLCLEKTARMEVDGFVEHKITLYTHTGTHIDVPSHISDDGLTIDELSIDRFIGRAAVIDLTKLDAEEINRETLSPRAGLLSEIDYLILKTGWEKYWGDRRYFKGFPVLNSGAAEWLATFKLKGIGIDTISIETLETKTFPIHRTLFKNNIMIVENLAHLDEAGDGIFTFSCLPLNFKNGDGSPVRAIGILE